jgi:hypothetical protein
MHLHLISSTLLFISFNAFIINENIGKLLYLIKNLNINNVYKLEVNHIPRELILKKQNFTVSVGVDLGNKLY